MSHINCRIIIFLYFYIILFYYYFLTYSFKFIFNCIYWNYFLGCADISSCLTCTSDATDACTDCIDGFWVNEGVCQGQHQTVVNLSVPSLNQLFVTEQV